MPIKMTPVYLADNLCSVVLLIRQFGEINSPYLTRLENEILKKGWRYSAERAVKVRSELEQRQTQVEVLLARLKEAFLAFGLIDPAEKKLLNTYWDEAADVRSKFQERARGILRHIPR